MTGVQLRRAGPRDADAVADVFLEARHISLPWLPLVHTDEQCRTWIAAHVIPELETWVAALGGDVAAMMAIDTATAFVDALYVSPRHQRRGLGSTLLETAQRRNSAGLELWCFQRNVAARRFYEQHGFTCVEETSGSGNEEREPDARYRWVPASSSTVSPIRRDAEPAH